MSDTRTMTFASGYRATDDFRPVADYGLLADCNSAALVDRYGSVDWLCLLATTVTRSSPACLTRKRAIGRSGRSARTAASAATWRGRW